MRLSGTVDANLAFLSSVPVKRLSIPVYDVSLVGYPQRMREYTARQRAQRERDEP